MAKLTPETTAKKPPYFSKEARAAREATQPIISQNLPDSKSVEQKPMDSTIQTLLKRIEELEAKDKVRDENDPMSIASMKDKHYTWPSKYAVSLRGWIPVLAWESFRKDPTKDFEFKNQFGQYETNHYMRLMLADGTQVEVTNYNFLRDRSKTEPMFCKEVKDESWKTTYVFDTGTYGQLTILNSNFLN